jgi:hypothetical protein
MATGIWTEVDSDDQIHTCSTFLQFARTRYKGSLTKKNLKKLLQQTKKEDQSDMFAMFLYQDDDDSDYDLVLVEYLSLNRNSSGTPQQPGWCLTFGMNPNTTKTATQIYAILKAEIQLQMKDDPSRVFQYVYLDIDSTFTSGSLFDQVVQLLFADVAAGNVTTSGDLPVSPPPGAFANDNPTANTLHRFQIQNIK